jgi:hypothetical protein
MAFGGILGVRGRMLSQQMKKPGDPSALASPGSTPSIWGDLNLGGQNQNQLSEQEQLQRKKKVLSAGRSNEFQSATSMLFGNRQQNTGSMGV